jgi:hypothetical protein
MRLHFPVLVLLLPVAFAAGMAATSPLDPVRVAPHIYEVAFENDRVRVLRKTIRNGETPPIHSQPDRVIVYLNPCAWLVEEGDGGTRMQSFKFGEPVWAPAETHGGVTATVIQQCSIVEIELL